MKTAPPEKVQEAILRSLGHRAMSAALIGAKVGRTGSEIHNLCYRMIALGLIERNHNGRGWEYSKCK